MHDEKCCKNIALHESIVVAEVCTESSIPDFIMDDRLVQRASKSHFLRFANNLNSWKDHIELLILHKIKEC